MDGFKYYYENGIYTKKDLYSFMPFVISAQDYKYITGEDYQPQENNDSTDLG